MQFFESEERERHLLIDSLIAVECLSVEMLAEKLKWLMHVRCICYVVERCPKHVAWTRCSCSIDRRHRATGSADVVQFTHITTVIISALHCFLYLYNYTDVYMAWATMCYIYIPMLHIKMLQWVSNVIINCRSHYCGISGIILHWRLLCGFDLGVMKCWSRNAVTKLLISSFTWWHWWHVYWLDWPAVLWVLSCPVHVTLKAWDNGQKSFSDHC